MGRYLFRLPDVGEGVAEAEIVKWYVQTGDVVTEDQTLVDVMTDKATVDMTSPVDGIVAVIHGAVGAMLPVGSVLVEIEVVTDGDERPEADALIIEEPQKDHTPEPATSKPMARPEKSASRPVPPSQRHSAHGQEAAFGHDSAHPLAAPATRRRAYELGIPLQYVPGTGPAGRITSDDLDNFVALGGVSLANDSRYAAKTAIHDIPILGLRRRIAERMQESKRRIPHITYVEEADVTELEALRRDLNTHRAYDQPKLTVLSFLMRALVKTLPDFPNLNARYDDDAGVLQAFEAVHLGIATQTPGGLVVPVLRNAESRTLWELAGELARLSAAAREGAATREELGGSTITLTSLGALGGIVTSPVINYPEVAIIGPNKIVERPVAYAGQVTVRKIMNLSSSFDHRIVDGYDAALFVQQLKRMIEHPALIFMD